MSLETRAVWLTVDSVGEIESLLRSRGGCGASDHVVSVGSAGQGNMNVTLRVRLRSELGVERSVILKQARPWVAKYPTIEAPIERASVERRFYELLPTLGAGGRRVMAMMPRLYGGDASTHTLLLEDLGEAADYSGIYAGAELSDAAVCSLAAYLRELHDASEGRPGEPMSNTAMRALNHAHLCEVPLDPANGLDLNVIEPGLGKAAEALRGDIAYRARLAETGAAYRRDFSGEASSVLLHGDFFPGSWLKVGDDVRVIDPEFGFDGPRAFDVGVAVAHLVLAERVESARLFLNSYGDDSALDPGWVGRFAAVEVMRRLIGVAQLPIPAKPAGWRAGWVLASRSAMMSGDWEQLV